jgi:hypothetical protein
MNVKKTMQEYDEQSQASNKAFDNAIDKGLLSDNHKANNYAGSFMYMYSRNGNDYFKNIITRQYIKGAA